MKFECDMISDLLPLYKDEICSDTSKKIVEEHLAECPACRKIFNDMNDISIDEKIVKEKNEVIDSQAKFFKRKSAFAGSIIALIFTIPILVCFIVDLATGGGLGWFFIVLAAILTASALVVVPLMMKKNRMFTTMTAFTACVILLLAICCIYTGGNWFFVAASASLFGLTVLFAPFIVYRRPVNAYVKNQKGLAIMSAYTVTFAIMMACIGLFVGPAQFFPLAMAISAPLAALAWAIFAAVRYIRANAAVKTGVSILAAGIFSGILSHATAMAAVTTSNTGVTYYSDPWLPLMLSIGSAGLLLTGIGVLFGMIKGGKKNENK
ncbi:MAG: zf-HC2 domain-containing protein [Saccharofermentans sp.]|nr:zf-HC2 domain-containing protein [Saccharofermentans sp.]